MQLKKLIISFFLLLSYSTGIAHELIPHCHHSEVIGEEKHNHFNEQHSNDSDDKFDHALVSHDDHFDHCFVELLICVLSETDHPASHYNTSDYLPNNTNLNFRNITFSAVLAKPNFDGKKINQSNYFSTTSVLSYNIPLLSAISQRGPPSHSC